MQIDPKTDQGIDLRIEQSRSTLRLKIQDFSVDSETGDVTLIPIAREPIILQGLRVSFIDMLNNYKLSNSFPVICAIYIEGTEFVDLNSLQIKQIAHFSLINQNRIYYEYEAVGLVRLENINPEYINILIPSVYAPSFVTRVYFPQGEKGQNFLAQLQAMAANYGSKVIGVYVTATLEGHQYVLNTLEQVNLLVTEGLRKILPDPLFLAALAREEANKVRLKKVKRAKTKKAKKAREAEFEVKEPPRVEVKKPPIAAVLHTCQSILTLQINAYEYDKFKKVLLLTLGGKKKAIIKERAEESFVKLEFYQKCGGVLPVMGRFYPNNQDKPLFIDLVLIELSPKARLTKDIEFTVVGFVLLSQLGSSYLDVMVIPKTFTRFITRVHFPQSDLGDQLSREFKKMEGVRYLGMVELKLTGQVKNNQYLIQTLEGVEIARTGTVDTLLPAPV